MQYVLAQCGALLGAGSRQELHKHCTVVTMLMPDAGGGSRVQECKCNFAKINYAMSPPANAVPASTTVLKVATSTVRAAAVNRFCRKFWSTHWGFQLSSFFTRMKTDTNINGMHRMHRSHKQRKRAPSTGKHRMRTWKATVLEAGSLMASTCIGRS